jgi:hypothetical protein
MEVIENFETFPESINTPASNQRFRNYGKVRGGVSSGQIELSGLIWTLSPLPSEIWGNLEYQNPREFCNLSNGE